MEDDEGSGTWNVDFIAAIYAFDLRRPLELEELSRNIKEEINLKGPTSKYSAIFTPWKEESAQKGEKGKENGKQEEKPILLKNVDCKEAGKPTALNFKDMQKLVEKMIKEATEEKRKYARDLIETYKLFIAAVGSEKVSLDPHYLKGKNFVRVKLSKNVRIQFTEPLDQSSAPALEALEAEVHLLIHKSGIVIATLYTRPISKTTSPVKTLDTEQIIEIERRLQEEKVKINDDPEEKKLEEYLENKLEELFKDELKIKKKKNSKRKAEKKRKSRERRSGSAVYCRT